MQKPLDTTDGSSRRTPIAAIQSLWQRSKGMTVKDVTESVSNSGSKSSFRKPGLTGSPDEQYLRRREQVRRAQRTHRERKEAYLHLLEEEITVLRRERLALTQRAEKAEAEVRRLMGIMFNANPPPTYSTNTVPITALMHQESDGDEVLQLDFENVNALPHPPCQASSTVAAPASQRAGENSQTQQDLAQEHTPRMSPFSAAQGASVASNQQIEKRTLSQIGIEFVLSLEHPCFSHIRKAPQNSSNGHVISAHSAILDCQVSEDASSWHVPSDSLDRLLQLSYSLPLDGEITPVQAWQRLCACPGFNNCDVESLKSFQADLLPEVRCYGFGAVLDEDIFESLASSFFLSLRQT